MPDFSYKDAFAGVHSAGFFGGLRLPVCSYRVSSSEKFCRDAISSYGLQAALYAERLLHANRLVATTDEKLKTSVITELKLIIHTLLCLVHSHANICT